MTTGSRTRTDHRRSRRSILGGLAILLLVAAALAPVSGAPVRATALGTAPLGASSPEAAVSTPTVYTPLAPSRVLDTADRSNDGGTARTTPVGSRIRHRINVADAVAAATDLERADVRAAAISVTVHGAGSDTSISAAVRPDDATSSTVPAVMLDRAGIRSATTFATLRPDGSIELAVSTTSVETTRVTVDLLGAFTRTADVAPTAGRFITSGPEVALDTRISRDPVTAGTTRVVPMPTSVPADATAVTVQVTVHPRDRQPGTVVLGPAGAPPSDTVHLGVGAGDVVRAATTIVPLDGASDAIAVTPTFSTEVVVEVLGHVTGPSAPTSGEGLFVPLPAPARAADTLTDASASAGGIVAARVQLPSGIEGAGTMVGTSTAFSFDERHLTAPSSGNGNGSRRGSTDIERRTASRTPPDIVSSNSLVLAPIRPDGTAAIVDHGGAVVVDQIGILTGSADPDAWPAHPAEVRVPVHPSGYCDTIAPGNSTLNTPGRAPIEIRRIGTSVRGQPIWAELHGTRGAGRTAIIVNQVHGDECALNRLLRMLRITDLSGAEVWVIPTLTPDGYEDGTRRNARDRDLNGDGHTRSEPETRALMSFTEQLRPDLTVHVHTPNGFVGWYGGPASEALARRIGARAGLRVSDSGTRPDRGRWFLWQGQQQFWRHDTLLVEMLAISDQEVPGARPRPPTRSIEVADDHARIIVEELLDHLRTS